MAIVFKPLLIGLPGAGKSTMSRILAKKMDMKVVSTDPKFRECRKVPIGSDDPRRTIMERFLERVKTEYNLYYVEVAEKANGLNAKCNCFLEDSTLFRQLGAEEHGEDIFRLYEIELLRWCFEQGEFEEAIVDLSASAPLYKENRDLFSRENGFLPILLDTPFEQIYKNLLKDYSVVVEARKIGNEIQIRGNYEDNFDKALKITQPSTSGQRKSILLSVAKRLTLEAHKIRMPKYLKFAAETIIPASNETPENLGDKIFIICHNP